MLRVGLNPYGLSYTVGLTETATPCERARPIGMAGFIALAREMGAKCVELDGRWLAPMTDADLARLGEELAGFGMTPLCSDWLAQQPGETLAGPIRCARALGAPILRLHLTPVLEGARARWGARWGEMVAHARATLKADAPRATDAGVVLAVENHQDFTSEELLAIVEETGERVGLVLDTGNPFAVGEDPLEFTRRAAHRIRHVHLKDYVAQFTDEAIDWCAVRSATGACHCRKWPRSSSSP
jgi:sugar phosphate isomerase/epimerase